MMSFCSDHRERTSHHQSSCAALTDPALEEPLLPKPDDEPELTPLQRRLARLELSIIEHPSHLAAMSALEGSLARARATWQGRPLKAKARLVCGFTGAGKTTLIEAFQRRYPDISTPDGDVRRVVVVEMPRPSTQRALVSAILHEFGYRAGARDSADTIITSIVNKVRQIGVELIIIDEGHHMMSGTALWDITEFIKSLLNRIGCQIAIVGLPDLRQISKAPQLNRRLEPDIILEPYDWTTVEGRIEFITLMHDFESVIELPSPSNLSDEMFAMRMYAATGGSIGIVSKYLSRAVEIATQRGLGRLTPDILAEVYAAWSPDLRNRKMIDFTAKLDDVNAETTLDELKERRQRVALIPEDNPFLCSVERCGELWQARSGMGPDEIQPIRRSLRGSALRVKGKGMKVDVGLGK